VLENPAVQAARVALVAPGNPAVRVRVALAAPGNPAVRVALAVPENPVVPAVKQVLAALLRQVEVPEKEAQTRSAGISRRQAVAAVAPLLAGVGALLKPRAAGVAVA